MRNFRSSRNTLTCPDCGHRNRASARLCTECYASLSGAADRDDFSNRDDFTNRTALSQRDELPALRRSGSTRRGGSQSRADAIRAKVRGSQSASSYDARSSSRDTAQPWWQDWKLGAALAGFLGLMGLRKTELGKDLRDLDGQDILDKLL